MIAAEILRLRFQATLARGLAAPEIARRAGLAAASEVWGGEVPRELPAWYLWLAGGRGAWQVELAEARALEGTAAVVGTFTVRHYPAAGDPLLAAFDAEERAAAASLDRTGTPRIEVAAELPARLFAVGAVEWALDLEADASVLVLTSLDRLRTRRGGEGLRDVPGWALSRQLFTALAGLHAQVDRRAAVHLVLARQPGFELVSEGGDGPGPRDAADVSQGEALVAFAPAGGCGGAARRLLRALRDEDAEVLADEPLDRAGAGRAVAAASGLGLDIDAAWFGGEAHREVSACACAC